MQLTQSQLRDLVGIGEEKFRTWREALLPLHAKSGHGHLFSMGDALALMVVNEFAGQYGAKISKLRGVSENIFDACADFLREPSSGAFLVINLATNRLTVCSLEGLNRCLTHTTFVVPLQVLSERLKKGLVPDPPPAAQLDLPLSR